MKTICLPLSEYIERFRDKNKFFELCKACKNFNSCWSCPPYEFDEDKIFEPYNYIYIFAKIITPDKNFKDVRRKLDKKILCLESKHKDSLAFFAGSCVLCDKCSRVKGKACKKPKKMRYSLESQGFDMCKTTEELLDIKIKWGENGALPEYYTLVSALCTKEKIKL